MTRKRHLTDDDVAELRQRADAGEPTASLADAYGITPQYTGRLINGKTRPPREPAPERSAGPVEVALSDLLSEVDLNPDQAVNAAAAQALAKLLDAAAVSDAISAAVAAPRLAGQLGELLGTLPNGSGGTVGKAMAALEGAKARTR